QVRVARPLRVCVKGAARNPVFPKVRVHGPRVTSVQIRTRCRSAESDRAPIGPEATAGSRAGRLATPPSGIRSFATREFSVTPPRRRSRGFSHRFESLQSGPAVIEQAQLGQLLRQFLVRRVCQRVGHFVQKESGKLLSGAMQDLSNSGG